VTYVYPIGVTGRHGAGARGSDSREGSQWRWRLSRGYSSVREVVRRHRRSSCQAVQVCARSRRRSDDKGCSRRGERVGAGEGRCSESAAQGKKETRAGADGGAGFCGHGRGLKPICRRPSRSGPGTRPRMCGWTRQGRPIEWCQGGNDAAAPFQRSWRRAATSSTRGAGSQRRAGRRHGRVACRRERARRASAERDRASDGLLPAVQRRQADNSLRWPQACSTHMRGHAAGRHAYTAPLLPTPYLAVHLPKPSLPRPTRYGHACTPHRIRALLRGHGVVAGCCGGIDDVPICQVSASSERHQPTRKLSSTALALTRRLRLLSPARRQGLPALIL
jgi:hypothetical protein